MITWQHIENAKQLMIALAIVEMQGNRAIADTAVKAAQRTAKALTEDDHRPTTALEVLALQIRSASQGAKGERALVVYFMAALAIEFGLEADDTARAEAAILVARARS